MSDDRLESMSEQEIRARFRHAPAYYLQAKLERKRAIERRRQRAAAEMEDHRRRAARDRGAAEPAADEPVAAPHAVAEPVYEPPASLPNDLLSDSDIEPFAAPHEPGAAPAPMSLDLALPGYEILEAALAQFDEPEPAAQPDPGLTQHAVLEAALEEYGNWPFLSEPATGGPMAVDPEVESWFEPDHRAADAEGDGPPRLELVHEPSGASGAESDLEELLQHLLDSEPDLDLVLDADPELEEALASEAEAAALADNVTRGDFGGGRPSTVRVVSVAMDRKRPNMVRIVRESSRLAS